MLQFRLVRWSAIAWIVLLMPQARGVRSTLPPAAPTSVAAANSEPLAIVVNRSNPTDSLSSAELRQIFLGNRNHWPNGRRITIVMREPGDPERKIVLRDVCSMSEVQFKNHFLHGLYNGDILVSPKSLASSSGMRKFVFNVPGAIGYLKLSEVDESVKIVRIDELQPDDKRYRLHVQALTDE